MQKTLWPKFPLHIWQIPFEKRRVPGQGEGSDQQFYFWYPWVPIAQWNTKTCWCILISNFWFFWDGLVLMYIYYNKKCTVKWSGARSSWFNVKNGVRQGGITWGIFFAVYIDELLTILRKSKLGCRIYGIFYGALIYADDILLLSASRGGLQAMVDW